MIYNLEKELTKAIEEEEVEFQYAPPVSGGAKETANKWKEAFENAIKIDMALGGSTNTVLHLLAIAREFERVLRRRSEGDEKEVNG